MAERKFEDVRWVIVRETGDWSLLDAYHGVALLNDREVKGLGADDYPSVTDETNREFVLADVVRFAWNHGYFDQAKNVWSEDDYDWDAAHTED